MRRPEPVFIAGGILLGLSVAAAIHLHNVETGSLVVYTTPAIRDLLEKGLLPAWEESGGRRVEPVYMTAGSEYNRLRMSGGRPEADLFIHASPLFLEKGASDGHFLPYNVSTVEPLEELYQGNESGEGGRFWYAFAWSPLVVVHSPHFQASPDLATADLRFGLAHPTLSNNGVYSALFFEKLDPEAGRHVRDRTVVQPVNARTNILGVADGSFDVTLGYEAVAEFFAAQGARIKYELPNLGGERVSTPVLFSASIVEDGRVEAAQDFVDRLFLPETQALLGTYFFRSVFNTTAPTDLPEEIALVEFDWENWEEIEAILSKYEVTRGD